MKMEKLKTSEMKAARGRPREFDESAAIAAAVELFWEKGYEATSMTDVVDRLGINRASLYAAFGDKESLFLLALKQYGAQFGAPAIAALSEFDDARTAIGTMLERMGTHLTDPAHPRGCLLANTALESGRHGASNVGRFVAGSISTMESLIYGVLRRAQVTGEIPIDIDVRALARFFVGAAQGMAVLSRVSSDPTMIRDVARVSLQAWPAARTVEALS